MSLYYNYTKQLQKTKPIVNKFSTSILLSTDFCCYKFCLILSLVGLNPALLAAFI